MKLIENQIQLTDIDGELKRLWEEQGKDKIRASLFNLIIYIQNDSRGDYYQRVVKLVVSKFPCRVLMIIANENPNEAYLKTGVSTETFGIEEVQIYCEIITIEVAGKLKERVPFIILPHLLPDLPIYLLWCEDPAKQNPILSHLESISDRILFDAAAADSVRNYCQTVLTLIRRFESEIADLSWTAISGWRSLFAAAFGNAESFFSISQSKLIRIFYSQKSSEKKEYKAEIQALYFQAWLASRMNWKFKGFEIIEGNIRITYSRPMNEVVVLLTPQTIDGIKQGGLISIELDSFKDKSHFSFKRLPQTRQVYMQYSDKERCDLPTVTNLSGIAEGQEIIEEIFYPSANERFKDTLDLLAEL